MLILTVLRNRTSLCDRHSQLVEVQLPIFQLSIVYLEPQKQSRLACVCTLSYFYLCFILFYYFLKVSFKVQCTFNIILLSFRWSAQWLDNHILFKCSPWHLQDPPGPVHSYYSIIDCIPCAALYIPIQQSES